MNGFAVDEPPNRCEWVQNERVAALRPLPFQVLEIQDSRQEDQQVQDQLFDTEVHLHLNHRDLALFHFKKSVRSGAPDLSVWKYIFRPLAGTISPPCASVVRGRDHPSPMGLSRQSLPYHRSAPG